MRCGHGMQSAGSSPRWQWTASGRTQRCSGEPIPAAREKGSELLASPGRSFSSEYSRFAASSGRARIWQLIQNQPMHRNLELEKSAPPARTGHHGADAGRVARIPVDAVRLSFRFGRSRKPARTQPASSASRSSGRTRRTVWACTPGPMVSTRRNRADSQRLGSQRVMSSHFFLGRIEAKRTLTIKLSQSPFGTVRTLPPAIASLRNWSKRSRIQAGLSRKASSTRRRLQEWI